MIEYEKEPKGYEELKEECECLRSENQRLSKELAYYRSRYGKIFEEGEEAIMPPVQPSGEEEVSVSSEKSGVVVTNQSPAEEKIKLFRPCFGGGKMSMRSGGTAKRAAKAGISPSV